jgi:hypothetical protein
MPLDPQSPRFGELDRGMGVRSSVSKEKLLHTGPATGCSSDHAYTANELYGLTSSARSINS